MDHQAGPAQAGPGSEGETGMPDGPVTAPAAGPPPETAAEAITAPGTTGDPRVDSALKLLDRLPGLPVSEHPELFEQVHARLSEVLGELDPGSAGSAG